MGLTKEMLLKIKAEIANDPYGVGYAGKTDAQIAQLLSSNIIKQRVVEDYLPSPINMILAGMGSAPNTIDTAEVTQAKITV